MHSTVDVMELLQTRFSFQIVNVNGWSVVELEFIRYPPSLLASGCICAAMPTVLPYVDNYEQSLCSYYNALHDIVGVDIVSTCLSAYLADCYICRDLVLQTIP